MPDLQTDTPSDQQVLDTLEGKSDILQRLATEPSMVITDRETDVEIRVNGHTVYDSHAEGHLPLADVVAKIADALSMEIAETDYAFDDGSLPEVAQAAARLASAKGVRCWYLDRAPYEDEPSDLPDISG